MVPASKGKISIRAGIGQDAETDHPLRGKEGDCSVNCSSLGRGKMTLTTSARVQLTVWAKLDAVDRAVMAL